MRLLPAFLLLAILALAVPACTGVPSGVTPVSGFDGSRYLGKWYEIARLEQRFQRGLTDVSAVYTRRADGSITVKNRGYDPAKGEWREIEGRARFLGDERVGSLKVSFFWPFQAGYHVIALDKQGYRYAMVTGPSKEYLWILSRDRVLQPSTLAALVAKAKSLGYETEKLIFGSQTRPDA